MMKEGKLITVLKEDHLSRYLYFLALAPYLRWVNLLNTIFRGPTMDPSSPVVLEEILKEQKGYGRVTEDKTTSNGNSFCDPLGQVSYKFLTRYAKIKSDHTNTK